MLAVKLNSKNSLRHLTDPSLHLTADKKSNNLDAIFDAVVFVSLSFRTVAVYPESETDFDNCHPYISLSSSMQFSPFISENKAENVAKNWMHIMSTKHK